MKVAKRDMMNGGGWTKGVRPLLSCLPRKRGLTPFAHVLTLVFLILSQCLAGEVWADDSVSEELNALLCDPSGWSYDNDLVSISAETSHVHDNGPGILFIYTRRSSDLWKPGEGAIPSEELFDSRAYRPTASKGFPAMDWSMYNELSFWVYVEGNSEEAFRIGFTGATFRTNLRRNEWVNVRWHFAEDERVDLANISRFVLQGVNQGTPPGDPQEARIYISDFRLEKAPERHIVGWAPDPGEIILPYSGFYPGKKVVALVAAQHAGKQFSCSSQSGTTVYSGVVSVGKTSARCEYAEIQLEAPSEPGEYVVSIVGGPSATLLVSAHPYEAACKAALTAVRAQRCGTHSELHGPCHLDDAVVAETGEALDVAGGWHDEGASQYVRGTLWTTRSLARFRLSHGRKYALGLNEGVQDDLADEVEWGARSILKYEIEPGVFLNGWIRPYWYYTDNHPGTGDERLIHLGHNHTPYYRWLRIETLALCSSVLKGSLKTETGEAAERLWDETNRIQEIFTPEELEYWNSQKDTLLTNAAKMDAAIALFRLTGDNKYADEAAELGNFILTLQDKSTPTGTDALYGYFYKTPKRAVPYNGINYGGVRDVPGRSLAELLKALPYHADAHRWRNALKRYAEGTLKPLARFNAPYGYVARGPFKKQYAGLAAMEEKRGDMYIYFFQAAYSSSKDRVYSPETGALAQTATAMAAMGRALGDEELTRMAHATLRYILGANPFHTSYMRHLGDKWPEFAQMPNVEGMTLIYMGFTLDGHPYFNPYGTCKREDEVLQVRKEGTTRTCAFLLDAASYFETPAFAEEIQGPKLRVLVDKTMRKASLEGQPVEEWMIKEAVNAGFNVYCPRSGSHNIDLMRDTADWCRKHGIYSLVWLRPSKVPKAGENTEGKRILLEDGREVNLWSVFSDEVWNYLTELLVEYAKITAATDGSLMGVFFDFENYDIGPNLYVITYEDLILEPFLAEKGVLLPADVALSERRSWLEAQGWLVEFEEYQITHWKMRCRALREAVDQHYPGFRFFVYPYSTLFIDEAAMWEWGTENAPFVQCDSISYGRKGGYISQLESLTMRYNSLVKRKTARVEQGLTNFLFAGGIDPATTHADAEYSGHNALMCADATDGYWVFYEGVEYTGEHPHYFEWFKWANDNIAAGNYDAWRAPRKEIEWAFKGLSAPSLKEIVDFSNARLRGRGPLFLALTEGKDATLTIEHKKLSSYEDVLTWVLRNERLEPLDSGTVGLNETKKLVITPTSGPGIYLLDINVGKNSFRLVDANVPVAISLVSRAILFIGGTGEKPFYFWVPDGTANFSVYAKGRGSENVRLAVYDPDGNEVASGETTLSVDKLELEISPGDNAGKIWSLRTLEPSEGKLEDHQIWFSEEIYPPVLSFIETSWAGPVAPIIDGDIDRNGKVDIADLVLVARAFGSSEGDSNWNPDADVNKDGTVDVSDLVAVACNFGEGV